METLSGEPVFVDHTSGDLSLSRSHPLGSITVPLIKQPCLQMQYSARPTVVDQVQESAGDGINGCVQIRARELCLKLVQ